MYLKFVKKNSSWYINFSSNLKFSNLFRGYCRVGKNGLLMIVAEPHLQCSTILGVSIYAYSLCRGRSLFSEGQPRPTSRSLLLLMVMVCAPRRHSERLAGICRETPRVLKIDSGKYRVVPKISLGLVEGPGSQAVPCIGPVDSLCDVSSHFLQMESSATSPDLG